MKTPIDKKGFIQINIVVSDIETAAAKWAELFGIEKPEIRINHLEGGEDYKYYGKPITCDLKVCDIEMENFTDMPFGEKVYEGGNLHRMYISEILYALKS